GGGFHKIVPAPPVTQTKPFPTKLSETGLFASTKDHTPAKGLIPYSVNAPLWSDNAEKDRLIALPGVNFLFIRHANCRRKTVSVIKTNCHQD
ncbi:MAG: hypothetical protein ACKN9F_08905, partial [Methylomonas sp.]